MTDLMTTTGVLVHLKPMKTSGKLQAIVEFEPEVADEALRRLGGLVKPTDSRWVAIAVLNENIEVKDNGETA
jgi:hypothetical protein